MAMSNKERQQRWRKKNRARYNLERRNARKNLIDGETHGSGVTTCKSSDTLPSSQTPKSKIEELRELITKESEKPVETPIAVPTVFRDDYGRVISETQWKKLQAMNDKAKEAGYERDEYSQ